MMSPHAHGRARETADGQSIPPGYSLDMARRMARESLARILLAGKPEPQRPASIASARPPVQTEDASDSPPGVMAMPKLAGRRLGVQVVLATAYHFQVLPADLCGPSRKPGICFKRQVGMYISRSSGLSLERVGGFFGGRDHTTARHAFLKIGALRKTSPLVGEHIAAIVALLSPDGGGA